MTAAHNDLRKETGRVVTETMCNSVIKGVRRHPDFAECPWGAELIQARLLVAIRSLGPRIQPSLAVVILRALGMGHELVQP